MRRKRRTKYTWLPVSGTIQPVGDDTYWLTSREDVIDIGETFAPTTSVISIAQDWDSERDTFGESMGEIVGNEYFLRRIVGKFHCAYSQDSRAFAGGEPPQPSAAIVTVGFFIARSRALDEDAGGDQPIGFDSSIGDKQENFDGYSPASFKASREPWIWRRQWILGNNAQATTGQALGYQSGAARYPPTNAHYGSVLDGPHIDAKTLRRVTQENRLWFAVTAQGYNTADDGSVSSQFAGHVQWRLDVRLLGALRRARNRGAF